MSRFRTVLAMLVGIAALPVALVVAPSTVEAAPSLQYWTGTVTKISDGDTIWVDIAGDGTSKSYEVRNAGIQATEIVHVDKGIPADECHSREAMARMTELVFGTYRHVRLSAYYASSTSQGRLMRYVDVDRQLGAGENWVDTQKILLEEGYAWWKPETLEPAHNESYHTAAEVGMRAGGPLYNPNYHYGPCKEGPAQSTPITVSLKYNGYSPIYGNYVNGEYVKVTNGGSADLALGGWLVRDTSHDPQFTFPKSAVVKAGQSVYVRAGSGTTTSTTFYWGRTANPFIDPTFGRAYPGDSIYLLDPDGDVRDYMVYPCVTTCSTALASQITINNVVFDAPGDDGTNPNGEYIQVVRKPGVTSANLAGKVVESYPYNRILPTGTVLDDQHPTLRVRSGKGTDNVTGSTMYIYMGADHGMLDNAGDTAVVRDLVNARFACYDWGNSSC